MSTKKKPEDGVFRLPDADDEGFELPDLSIDPVHELERKSDTVIQQLGEKAAKSKWYFIKIPPRRDKEDPLYPTPIINGKRLRLARNTIQCVPWEVLHNLDNTQHKKFELKKNPATGRDEMMGYPVQRIEYEIIASASPARAAAWWKEKHGLKAPTIIHKPRRESRVHRPLDEQFQLPETGPVG